MRTSRCLNVQPKIAFGFLRRSLPMFFAGIRSLILAAILVFASEYACQEAFAANILSQVDHSFSEIVESFALSFLTVLLVTCFVVGLVLCVTPIMRPYGYGLLAGVAITVLVILAFTGYMRTIDEPLTKVLENQGNIVQLLENRVE